jgi:hypothetical protein
VTVRFKIGADIRSWTSYEVDDLTPEELDILSRESDESVALVQRLEEAKRLTWLDMEYDDNPDIFADYASPAVIDVEVDEDTTRSEEGS